VPWLALLLLAAGLSMACSARADDGQLEWAVSDWPPGFILKNGKAPARPQDLGGGVFDRASAEIIARMPRYRHSFVRANLQHILADFSNGENLCTVGLYRTDEREKVAYFAPILVSPAVALVVRQDRQAAMQLPTTTISLKHLVDARKDLAGILESSRSYGSEIDAILEQPGANLRRTASPESGYLLHALDIGRMDYTLENPLVVEFGRQRSAFAHPLVTIALDDAPLLSTSYVACTRNAWGQKVMSDITAAVRDAARAHAYREIVNRWIPTSRRAQYRAQMAAFYDALAH
jgi:uncharacterized protein (TIGR02285 family)